ncbi:hypothetical protein DL89DRAFT_254120 [Linderina pennispora]|uniref:Transferase-domain-containing protein n=1 Tax=Linderina pennispora TaxID=61395 RepID=A0A1Y1WKZ0_9FUNG|nr:uncharacterized protein DL89DRAFT_254120 [Linderina pennispora]ORX74250.1 hypothetical protein DL89DRAFT_254120 [Linderina pennispora]
MSQFLTGIDSKIYDLTKYDVLLSSYNVCIVFFYANDNLTDSFMPSQELEDAYYKTVLQFPLLAGQIKKKGGGTLQVVVDKSDLNLPGYRESQSDTHFSDIKSADFNPTAWPSDLAPVGNTAYPDRNTGVIKLLNTHVVRLKDNSGIIISFNTNHVATDAFGSLEFFNQWAAETRALVTGVHAEKVSYCFDREAIQKHLPSKRLPLDDTTFRAYTIKSRIADWLLGLSPNSRAKLLNYLGNRNPTRGHLFRISREKFDHLHSRVLECMPPGVRLTSNDLLSAIAYKVHGQAKLDADAANIGWLGRLTNRSVNAKGEHGLSVACDLRGLLGMSDTNYIGNPLFTAIVNNQMSHAEQPITPQTLAEIGAQVRRSLSNVSPPFIGSFIDFVDSDSFKAGSLIASGMKSALITLTSNITRAKLYHADFGSGVQAFSTVCPNYRAVQYIILPAPPPSKDILVNFTASASEMEFILKNEFWRDITTLVY